MLDMSLTTQILSNMLSINDKHFKDLKYENKDMNENQIVTHLIEILFALGILINDGDDSDSLSISSEELLNASLGDDDVFLDKEKVSLDKVTVTKCLCADGCICEKEEKEEKEEDGGYKCDDDNCLCDNVISACIEITNTYYIKFDEMELEPPDFEKYILNKFLDIIYSIYKENAFKSLKNKIETYTFNEKYDIYDTIMHDIYCSLLLQYDNETIILWIAELNKKYTSELKKNGKPFYRLNIELNL
jgi:hypothetical protein